ncbi:MAG TPA: DUF4270 family protein [Bacteroidia bacterium]|nr:DUF4270 family protein [Bacteroidia bacterium]
MASCKKDTDIGANLQPQNELINLLTTDTTSLLTYTVPEDSVRSDKSPTVQLGCLNDGNFGKTTASLFSQFVIPNNLTDINFGTGAAVDSLVLYMRYDFDYYGDTMTTQTFNVYQMQDSISWDSAYYSNQRKSCFPGSIGSASFLPTPRSKSVVEGDTVSGVLRIPISNAWAQNFINWAAGGNMHSNSTLLQVFYGLWIVPDSNLASGGALLRFTPQDTLTGLKMYYHNSTDTASFTFAINAGTAYYSYFQHNFNGISSSSPLYNQLHNPGANSDPEVYIQSAAGLKTKIEFPFLSDWMSSTAPIAVNKAELIIKADPTQASNDLPINKQLYLVYLDSAGNSYVLPDMFENSTYYGGSVITTTSEYHINLARYFQEIVTGRTGNYGMYLKEISPVIEGRRAVLGSPNSTGYKMYLHLVYTRVN